MVGPWARPPHRHIPRLLDEITGISALSRGQLFLDHTVGFVRKSPGRGLARRCLPNPGGSSNSALRRASRALRRSGRSDWALRALA